MKAFPATLRVLLVGAILLTIPGACRDEADAMERDRFIATYVELRTTALRNPGGRITPAQKEEILARNGVTEDELLEFAEVHGRDVDYMARVWGEVEGRLHPQDTATVPPP
jgi:hypothetical protein